MRMNGRNRVLFVAALAALFCLANATRGAFRERIRGPRFEAESAAHFRYTAMVARGENLPALDVRAQWPEGLRVFRETSPAMEYLYGWTYRVLPGRPGDLASFVRFFTAFLFSLAIVPLALLSARLWRSGAAGIFTGLVFAVAAPLVARSSGFEYIRENLALPLIVLHAACFVSARGGGGRAPAAGSALAIFAALLSWHGTQFYLAPFLLFMLARAIVAEIPADERRAMRWIVAAIAAAGVAVPYLREGRFLLSIPAALAAAWLGVDLVRARAARRRPPAGRRAGAAARFPSRRTRALVAAAVIAAVLVPAALSASHFASYSHFFELVAYKLRYLRKPDDPRLLPFDARAFWVGPFNAPDPLHFFVFALPLLMLLPGPLSILAKRAGERDFEALFALVSLAVSFALFLLMQRLSPLFGVFAALAAGGIAAELRHLRGAAALRRPTLYLALLAVVVSLFQAFAWEGRRDFWRSLARRLRVPSRETFVLYPYARDVGGDLLAWMRGNLERDAVVLAPHYLSPAVLTYAERATNLNDFFESPALRRKAHRLLGSLYASEDDLHRFAREQGSTHLLVSCAIGADPTKDSPLYQAGLVNMPPGCAAYLLMFEPERLARFDLVYENEMYRLFRVGRSPAARDWPRSPLFYDRELLWSVGGNIGDFYGAAMRIYALTARGRSLVLAGDDAAGERALVEALRVFYFYPAWRALDGLYARRGRMDEREAAAAFAHRMDPNRADVRLALAESRAGLGRTDGLRELLSRCLAPGTPADVRGRAEALLGRLGEPLP
jgi:tetratricopeptide (TPR) repeat protein